MGQQITTLSSMIGCLNPNDLHFTQHAEEIKCIMLGKKSSGKTSILYKLFMDEKIQFPPTSGFHKENLKHKGYLFSIFDVGGEDFNEWKQYIFGKDVLIYVVDINGSFVESSKLLHKIMCLPEMENTVLVIFANKSDLVSSENQSEEEIETKMNLKELKQSYKIIKTRIDEKEEYLGGFDWILETLRIGTFHPKDQ
jgi:small GTP-binding protein